MTSVLRFSCNFPQIIALQANLTRIMPAQELPKVLKNLMDTLLCGNMLHSWNIFEERNGHIVVKIRFSGGHVDQATPISYKRKAPSQVKRDGARLAKHKARVSTQPENGTCLSTQALRDDKQHVDLVDSSSHLSLRRSERHKLTTDSTETNRAEDNDDVSTCSMRFDDCSMTPDTT